eukprot:7910344-Pyramimonas_sp.AAC.1
MLRTCLTLRVDGASRRYALLTSMTSEPEPRRKSWTGPTPFLMLIWDSQEVPPSFHSRWRTSFDAATWPPPHASSTLPHEVN